MSLRDFHLVFISAAVLCSVGFGYWAVKQYALLQGRAYLTTAIVSFLVACGLAVYEIFFLKKIKE